MLSKGSQYGLLLCFPPPALPLAPPNMRAPFLPHTVKIYSLYIDRLRPSKPVNKRTILSSEKSKISIYLNCSIPIHTSIYWGWTACSRKKLKKGRLTSTRLTKLIGVH